ncbi:hypothetical protein Hanom_Chr03g00221051 [Helianthus anomalus]
MVGGSPTKLMAAVEVKSHGGPGIFIDPRFSSSFSGQLADVCRRWLRQRRRWRRVVISLW